MFRFVCGAKSRRGEPPGIDDKLLSTSIIIQLASPQIRIVRYNRFKALGFLPSIWYSLCLSIASSTGLLTASEAPPRIPQPTAQVDPDGAVRQVYLPSIGSLGWPKVVDCRMQYGFRLNRPGNLRL
jgi:hypothetical protein